ncbi:MULTISPECIES: AraC family transcriptional regulator [Agrobacterium]|uniref:AraC family transcriptional regulator n=1 Tax=Agrobacterium tumefaciens TaxID=358 RepID=A0AAE6BFR1_AGRTU|nr:MULTISPECIES: AraC family transcriptional regulator [Agrobacterium]QCL75077.1 AraC family transcriptional regulator [Agrobacterium tumefaciens]QCL80637.1 AraC family transcriptional regulator [Agrobacterium tumefaciens]CUX62695.1 Transcriptional regulator, AraC family [Agrobacterium sp. NCPPB 925]
MDPLSDIVDLLRPSAAVSKPISGKGRWGVRYRAHDAPGFALVLAGAAWVMMEGRDPLRLERGDFLLLPTTPAFSLCSETDVECLPVEPQDQPVRHGEQEGMPDFLALGGSFTFERINASLLLSLMPGLIYVPAAEKGASRLARLIELLSEECASEDPGKELIIRRMLEVLLVEALRQPDVGNEAIPAGLVKGMRLPGLARALSAMHADVRTGWTVAELAGIAGMSRSAFSARFLEMVGCAPIEYLARWRMALARDALMRGVKSLDHIAEEIGYESASAFSTAFRKRNGVAPGIFARANGDRRRQVGFL